MSALSRRRDPGAGRGKGGSPGQHDPKRTEFIDSEGGYARGMRGNVKPRVERSKRGFGRKLRGKGLELYQRTIP